MNISSVKSKTDLTCNNLSYIKTLEQWANLPYPHWCFHIKLAASFPVPVPLQYAPDNWTNPTCSPFFPQKLRFNTHRLRKFYVQKHCNALVKFNVQLYLHIHCFVKKSVLFLTKVQINKFFACFIFNLKNAKFTYILVLLM